MIPSTRPTASRNTVVLTATRTVRGFGAGALSVVLALDLQVALYDPLQIGIFLGVAMGGAALWSLLLPRGGGLGSRKFLFALGSLALAAGGFLLWTDLSNLGVLLGALALGGIVAGGSDISPLGALEQGTLAHAAEGERRTLLFAFYNLAGYLGGAMGALAAGPLRSLALSAPNVLPTGPHDPTLLVYGLLGLLLVPSYFLLSAGSPSQSTDTGLRPLSKEHRRPILELSGLFSVDAFGGGLIANALVALFLELRFHASAGEIGIVLAAANIAAAVSLLLAVPLARRFGLINTMVFTHIPSSVLLILFAFTPALPIAGVVWVARATLSQMDVPTRQSYTQAIVPREEGAAAAGYTTAARSAQALGAPVSGAFLGAGAVWLAGPFALAGAIKIAYDLALFARFRSTKPPEERAGKG